MPDTHTITVNCGANGAQVGPTAYNPLDGIGSFDCFFADGPATTNVTATVTDSDGAADTDNQLVTVTVDNVAPVRDCRAPTRAPTRARMSAFDLGTFSDAGSNDADWTRRHRLGRQLERQRSMPRTQDGLRQRSTTPTPTTAIYSVTVCVSDEDLAETLRHARGHRRQRGSDRRP